MGSGAGNTTVATTSAGSRGAVDSSNLALVWMFPQPSQPTVGLCLADGGELVIGRDEGCAVHLPGNDVSRRHAALRREATGMGVEIVDLGSRNGARVNGQRVSSAHLRRGDVVRLGGWLGVVTEGLGAWKEIASGLWGGATLQSVLAPLQRAASSDLPVILEGETGTGKEVVTRSVHKWSGRSGPLVAVNCAALPEALAEGELFGYRRGAFTGADKPSQGFFRSAEGGTLLLDEVTDLPLPLQAKLLRVLEEHEVQPLGETRPIPIDVRVVVAGQQSLLEASRQGRFRPDLLARLDGVTVHLPPLRSRREDVSPLFSHFLTDLGRGTVPSVDVDFIERLCLHDWPFNVREAPAARSPAHGSARWRVDVEGIPPARENRRPVANPSGRCGRNGTAPSRPAKGSHQGGAGRTRGAPGAGLRLARLGWQRGPRGGDAGHLAPACLPFDGGPNCRSRGVARARASAQGGRAVSTRSQTGRVGELVGDKYRILRVIAEGGMGVVYEAQHAVVKRRFAVKFLRPDLADRRDLLTRFHREAQAAGALESENIAAAIDFGILADGAPYIVMEHLVGESLGSLLAREGCLPVWRAVDICLQACRGMEAAHAAGIVHRDLKPENLFLSRREDGTDLVKVLDFGIAKLEQIELNNAATRTGTILGTPAYMSPEQARGDKSIDHRTDVYGLAAILFEMLSGKPPHPGDSHNAVLHHIATQPALSLLSIQPDLPAPLVDAVERALSCDRSQRHASVEALGLELTPFAKREAWPPPKSTDPIPVVLAASPTPGWRSADVDAATIPASGRPPRKRRRPRTIFVVSSGLVATVAIAMTMAARSSQHSTVAAPTAESGSHRVAAKEVQRAQPPPTRSLDPPAPSLPQENREGKDRNASGQASATVADRTSEASVRPKLARGHTGRPLGRPAGRPIAAKDPASTPSVAVPPLGGTEARSPRGVTFDTQNPYGN